MGPALQPYIFVGQGPRALPGVREKSGSGRRERRPQRKCILWCVGAGLCPARGRPQGSPLRRGYKRHGEVRNPPVTASPCQPPLGKGAEGTGVADCHSQCAHWLRNDRFYMGHGANGPSGTPAPTDRLQVMRWGGRPRGSPLRKNLYWGVTHKSFS